MGASKYEMVETASVHIRDAGDEPMYAEGANGEPDKSKPMRITMYGPGSKVYATAVTTRTAAHLKKASRGLKPDQLADAMFHSQLEFLTTCTKEFENMEELIAPGTTGRDAVLSVYSNDKISFIRDQASALHTETSNFKPGSSKS